MAAITPLMSQTPSIVSPTSATTTAMAISPTPAAAMLRV
jgi:hypothetical protein